MYVLLRPLLAAEKREREIQKLRYLQKNPKNGDGERGRRLKWIQRWRAEVRAGFIRAGSIMARSIGRDRWKGRARCFADQKEVHGSKNVGDEAAVPGRGRGRYSRPKANRTCRGNQPRIQGEGFTVHYQVLLLNPGGTCGVDTGFEGWCKTSLGVTNVEAGASTETIVLSRLRDLFNN